MQGEWRTTTLPVGDASPGEGAHTNWRTAAGGSRVCISAPFTLFWVWDFHGSFGQWARKESPYAETYA